MIGAALVELVLPRFCIGCAAPGPTLCHSCRDGPVIAVGDTVRAAGAYDGALRAALLAFKERGRRDLAEPLGGLLADAVRSLLDGSVPVALVPVPSSPGVARRRGGDHVLRLARVAARELQVPVAQAMRLRRRVRDSAGLGIQDRAVNLQAAISACRAPPGVAAVVVDDIVTTGATADEAGRALATAGWPVLGVAVVAATPRRRTS